MKEFTSSRSPRWQCWKQRRCYHGGATSGAFTSPGKLGMKHVLYKKKVAGRFLDGFRERKRLEIYLKQGLRCKKKRKSAGFGRIAWNDKCHSWGQTVVLEKFAAETLWNLNTKRLCGKCDRSINVWIRPAYQCGVRSKKLCSVGWEESSSFIKYLGSGQLHYHNTELLYHETNILSQKDSLVDRLGYCAQCASFVCVRRLDLKKWKLKNTRHNENMDHFPLKRSWKRMASVNKSKKEI